jgi:putative ABC transport system permease protein
MTRFRLALSAYRRHAGRTIFTVLSVATAFAIFVVLAAIEHGMDGHISLAAAQRLDIEPAINAPLPVSYGATIRATPHVTAVTYDTAFVGYFRDPKQRVLVIGDAVPTLFDVYPEVSLPDDQKEAFLHDRGGAMISDEVAAKMGWHIGQSIPIQDGPAQANGSTTWLFHIDGIFHEDMPEGSARFMNVHYEYINEGIPPSARKDTVDKFDAMVDDPKNVDSVAAAIDARLANSSPDTRTQTVQEEALSEMRQFGDVGAVITYVGLAVFASMLLITGNTMANSVRERLNEFAMMRAIGFSRAELAFIVFREAAILVGAGAALGVLAGWGLVRLMEPVMTETLISFSLTWWAVASAAALALFFALATGFLPGRQVTRMPVATTLRRI